MIVSIPGRALNLTSTFQPIRGEGGRSGRGRFSCQSRPHCITLQGREMVFLSFSSLTGHCISIHWLIWDVCWYNCATFKCVFRDGTIWPCCIFLKGHCKKGLPKGNTIMDTLGIHGEDKEEDSIDILQSLCFVWLILEDQIYCPLASSNMINDVRLIHQCGCFNKNTKCNNIVVFVCLLI